MNFLQFKMCASWCCLFCKQHENHSFVDVSLQQSVVYTMDQMRNI